MRRTLMDLRMRRLARCAGLLGALILLFFELQRIDHVGSDFQIFHAAALRFSDDPLTLYEAASIRSLQGFIYPPPAILFFLPFSHLSVLSSYIVFVGVLYLSAFCAMAVWTLLSIEETRGSRVPRHDLFTIVVLAVASGPFFSVVSAGQVDTVILLLCIGYITLIQYHRPTLAGAILVLGFWIKIYPVVLLVYGLRRSEALRIFAGFLVGLITIPLVALPMLPLELYKIYYMQFLPALSDGTIIGIYNQSASAFWIRLNLSILEPIETLNVYPIGIWIRIAILIPALAALASIAATVKRGAPNRILAAMMMTTIAPISPLGWGHTYVYMIPLMVATWFLARALKSMVSRVILAGIYVTILVPAYHQFPVLPGVPELFYKVLYSRYLFAALVLLAIAAILTGSLISKSRSGATSGPTMG